MSASLLDWFSSMKDIPLFFFLTARSPPFCDSGSKSPGAVTASVSRGGGLRGHGGPGGSQVPAGPGLGPGPLPRLRAGSGGTAPERGRAGQPRVRAAEAAGGGANKGGGRRRCGPRPARGGSSAPGSSWAGPRRPRRDGLHGPAPPTRSGAAAAAAAAEAVSVAGRARRPSLELHVRGRSGGGGGGWPCSSSPTRWVPGGREAAGSGPAAGKGRQRTGERRSPPGAALGRCPLEWSAALGGPRLCPPGPGLPT